MYEMRCRSICPRCGLFFDCEDLFPYDEVITTAGKRFVINADGSASSIDYDVKPGIQP
jgi:hypothetical protein